MRLSVEELARRSAYLKLRNAQLESDGVALGAKAVRLRQMVEHLHGRAGAHPSWNSGGAGS